MASMLTNTLLPLASVNVCGSFLSTTCFSLLLVEMSWEATSRVATQHGSLSNEHQ